MNGLRALRTRAAILLACEDGIALIMAVMIVIVLTVSAGAAIEVVNSTQTSSTRSRQSNRTLGAAEAGLDAGSNWAIQAETGTPQPSGTSHSGSLTLDSSPVSWTATKAADGLSWTVTSTGQSPDGKVTRKLEETLSSETETTPGTAWPGYGDGFFMGDPSADCTVLTTSGDTVGNGAQVTVPIYIASSLCLSGGSNPVIGNPSSGPPITVYIGGTLRVDGPTNAIGTPSSPVQHASIVNGCQIKPKNTWLSVPCDQQGNPNDKPDNGGGSGVWAPKPGGYDSNPQTETKPPLDATVADAAYQDSAPGPTNAVCTGALAELDDDSTRNTSMGTVRLLSLNGYSSASDFDCKSGSGELKWTYGSPGTLLINGEVFIDGNLDLEGDDQAVYQGNGTLYVDGTVSFSNGARLCGAPMSGSACSGNWDPTQNSLEIVAVNHQTVNPGWNMSGDAEFEGIAFLNGRYVGANGSWVQGPVIADSGSITGATKFKAITNPPSHAPGGSDPTTVTTWSVKSGSWRECPAATGCS